MSKLNYKQHWEIIRIKRGLAWVDVARKLNIGRKAVYEMVKSNNPTVKTVEKLCTGFDMKLSEFFKTVEDSEND